VKEKVGATAFPLYWPAGWARSKARRPARFGDTNVYRETQNVRAELGRMNARGVVISTNLQLKADGVPYANQRMPADPGVSVWFKLRKQELEWVEHALACDRWDRAEHNLRAIAKHIEALRGQSRWGVGNALQAFAGYVALPEKAGGRAWSEVLGVEPGASVEEIKTAFRSKAKVSHPDMGGSAEDWHELERAYRFGTKQWGVPA